MGCGPGGARLGKQGAQGLGVWGLGFRVGVGFFQVRFPDSSAEDHPEP